jgi:hypothetical protein
MLEKLYIDDVYKRYISVGYDAFMELVLSGARKKMTTRHGIDLELLHLSFSALERARIIEREIGGGRCNEWRDLSLLLKRIAHKIHRECEVKSDHEGFLKLVK